MHYSVLLPCASKPLRASYALLCRAAAFGLALLAWPACAAIPLIIRDVVPVDAHSGARTAQDVLVDKGVIQAMGEVVDVPDGAQEIDGQGRFLIPGLWDMHVHLSFDPRLSAVMPDLFLNYGITSVRDTGGNLDALQPVLDNMRRKGALAPRVYFAGPLLDGEPVVYGGADASAIGRSFSSSAEARAAVRELADAGVDFIKVYEMLSEDVFMALTDEARRLGLPVAGHVPLSMLASEAAPRLSSMEHLRNIELDCAGDAGRLLAQRQAMLAAGADEPGMALRSSIHRAQRDPAIGNEDPQRCERVLASLGKTIQVPTARLNALTQYPPFREDDWRAALADLPAALRKDWAKAPQYMDPITYRVHGEWTLRMLPRLVDADIPIGAGTDTPLGWAIPGYSLHRELEIMQRAGLSPRLALAAATLVPARFFGIEDQTGQVAPGFAADLLLLEANPLTTIRNTRGILAVISRGELVRE